MTVTVDHQPLAVGILGLRTIGQVLAHLQRANRLVVQMLIDGQEPTARELSHVRQKAVEGHTIFIETADPVQLGLEVLDDVTRQMPEARRLQTEAAELLQKNMTAKALEQLGCCVRIWQHAQESVVKVAELLRLDLETIKIDKRPLGHVLTEFSDQLRSIKTALESRDYVCLADILLYETASTCDDWLAATECIRRQISSHQ